VARSDAKVLITGESGVGKEIVARNIHTHGPRATHVFAPVNCAGLPETLLESELFGHVKGSFTGAYRDKPGKLETAHMGTIFLDEVGEMTLRMQGCCVPRDGRTPEGRCRRKRTYCERPRHRRDEPGPARDDQAGHVP
jgi:transcriptional regulator of aromatic amino acid metabolism